MDPASQAGSLIGQYIAAPAAAAVASDPATREALAVAVAEALTDPRVRAALRPTMAEAAIWLAGALTVGALAWRLIR